MNSISIGILAGLLASIASAAAFAQTAMPDRQAMMQQMMDERFKEADADGNGAISKAEFLAKAEDRFSKMDLNHDGQITKDEQEAIREKLQQWRANRANGMGVQ